MSDQVPLRATWIKAGRLSMAHMRLSATTDRDDTPALRKGRLVHMAVLEPKRFSALAIWRGGKRAGADWKEFIEPIGDGDYINEEESAEMLALSGAAQKALGTLPTVERTEVLVEWTDALYGPAVAHVDALTSIGSMIEIKTCAKIDERLFRSQAWSLGYNLQLGWYDHGLCEIGKEGTRYVLAIESKPPYCTAIYTVPEKVLKDGYEEAAEIARRYRICEKIGKFAGPYDGQTLKLEPPDWMLNADVDMEGTADI